MILVPPHSYRGPSPFEFHGIKTGDMLEKADHFLGQGLETTGGHPFNDRLWHFKNSPRLCITMVGSFDSYPSPWGDSYKIEGIYIVRDDKFYYEHDHIPTIGGKSNYGFWTLARLNESRSMLISEFTSMGLNVDQGPKDVLISKSSRKRFPNVDLTFSKSGKLMSVEFDV